MKVKNVQIVLLAAITLYGLPGHTRAVDIRSGGESHKAVPDYRQRLLDTAWQAVSKMPSDPHIRNRSWAQERIVTACLEIGEPVRAAGYADAIGNWRRGTAYADIALYYAKLGCREAARETLNRAEQLVANSEAVMAGDVIATGAGKEMAESLGEWRLDRVKAHIARTYIILHQADAAAEWGNHVGQDDLPKITASEASVCPAENYAEVRDALYALADTDQFEAVKHALTGLCELYDRFYSDKDRRHELAAAIGRYRSNMPQFIQIEILIRLAEAALENGDKAAGLSWARQAHTRLEEASFRPRLYFPMKAATVMLLFQGGDTDTALAQLDAMVQQYDDRRGRIIDIYRVAILCRIAEAAMETGRKAQARKLYGRAAQEAVVNGNSRPRADDLSEICRSMAVHQLEPSAEQFLVLENINANLGDPW